MHKYSLLAIFITLTTLTFSKEDLLMHVRDRLGDPVPNIEVSVNGKVQKTNRDGVVVFPQSVKQGKRYKVKIFGSEKYQDFVEKLTLPFGSNQLLVNLGWTRSYWALINKRTWELQVQELDSIIEVTDYSNFDSCDDTLGKHDEITAHFPGGTKLLQAYILDHVEYPDASIMLAEQGKVLVGFDIRSNGSITNIRILRGVSKDLDQEAVRLVRGMPKWVPGACNGEKLATRCILPVVFKLSF